MVVVTTNGILVTGGVVTQTPGEGKEKSITGILSFL